MRIGVMSRLLGQSLEQLVKMKWLERTYNSFAITDFGEGEMRRLERRLKHEQLYSDNAPCTLIKNQNGNTRPQFLE